MKAKEYFDKYFAAIDDPDSDECQQACFDLFGEMSKEVITISEIRHAQSNAAVYSVLKEINQKFNAVGDMCEKKYGRPVLKRNGFKNHWDKRLSAKGGIKT